jgi:hypothetical protein
VLLWVKQTGGGHLADVLDVHPAPSGLAYVMTKHTLLNPAFTSEAPQVLHEYLGPQMREGKAAPLDVPLNELVPAVVSIPGVIITAHAEVNDVLHTRPLRRVEKAFALAKHVDGVAGEQKRAVNTLQCRFNRLQLVEIEVHDGKAKVCGLLGIPGGRYRFRVGVGDQMRKDGFTDRARRSQDKKFRFRCHG